MIVNVTRVAALCCVGCVALAGEPAPPWWAEYGVLDPSQPGDNFSPANVGQLKHMARSAKTYLDQELPGGSGGIVHALEFSFGIGAGSDEHTAPANVGQLKAVAVAFYDRLISAGFDSREFLRSKGYASEWPYLYPWPPTVGQAENFAPLNIGQLKLVFSFDIATDSTESGLPDWWEDSWFGGPVLGGGATGSPGDTSVSLSQAYSEGRNPFGSTESGAGSAAVVMLRVYSPESLD